MKLTSWWKLLLCAVLCLAWILYPLSAVHAQDETPPPPDATEVADPPVESTPDTSTVTDTAEPSEASTPETVILIVATDTATDANIEATTSATAAPETMEPTDPAVESTPGAVMMVTATDTVPETVSAEENVAEAVTGLLVQVDANVSQEELFQSLSALGTVVQSDLSAIHYVLVNVPRSNYDSALGALSSVPGVQYVEANGELQLEDTIPNDPFFSSQYGLTNIRAPQAWDYTTGSSTVTIAVVDSGVDLTHPDLASHILSGYDFVNNDAEPMDDNGHGTHVAGIAAGVTNNDSGVAGVSWAAQIMPVKVLNATGNGAFDTVAQGVIYAVNNGAQVINLSLGGALNSSVLQSAIDYAYSQGVVVVAASGNANTSVFYPAAYPQVIAVAASDASNNRAWFSNYGPEVDVAAPGVDIYSTALGGGYEYRSGTSMASAYVTGEVALMLSIDSNLTPDQIASIIKLTALDIGAPGVDDDTGSGLIQADAAVIMVIPTQVVTEPPVSIEVVPTEPELQEEKPSRGQESPLPSPTSNAPAYSAPTLPASTPTEPEVSAQSVVGTPPPQIITTSETAAADQGSSNLFPAFMFIIILVIIGAMIFFYLRRNFIKS